MTFKINDKYTAYYARLFMAYHKGRRPYNKIFELRGFTGEHKEEFWRFHQANPIIYELFKEKVYQEVAAGHTKLSSKGILMDIRKEYKQRTY